MSTQPSENKHPAKRINKKQIKEMSDRFFKLAYKDLDDSGNKHAFEKHHDARSCWFSLKDITSLLTNNGFDPKKATEKDLENFGLRIYFGMHHPENSFQPSRPDYLTRRQLTAILVVTNSADGSNIQNHDQLKNHPKMHELSLNNEGGIDDDGSGDGLDNGMLCPPEPNCIGSEI